MIDQILTDLSKRFSIPEEALSYIKSISKYKKFSPREHLLHQGGKTSTLYIVMTGLIRSYSITDDKEWTSSFFKEGEVAGDLQGVILDKSAERSLMALEETTCFCVPYDSLKGKYEKESWLGQSVGEYMKHEYSQRARLKMDLLSLKPEDRYHYLGEHLPWLFERVSDRYIACYMGVTPVSYSRIKNRQGSFRH